MQQSVGWFQSFSGQATYEKKIETQLRWDGMLLADSWQEITDVNRTELEHCTLLVEIQSGCVLLIPSVDRGKVTFNPRHMEEMYRSLVGSLLSTVVVCRGALARH